MYEYYFTFRSLTLAQRASMQLSKQGIGASFQRAPKVISAMGCSYAVRVQASNVQLAASILRTEGILFEKTFRMGHDTPPKEVFF